MWGVKIYQKKIQAFQIPLIVKQWYYENMHYDVVKNQYFIKKQEAKGLLGNLGLRTPLSKVTVLDDILYLEYKINEIVHKFLLGWWIHAWNGFKPTRIYL